MYKGICITGLDGNFATLARLQPSASSRTQCVLEFDSERACKQFMARNFKKMFQMSVAFADDTSVFTKPLC